MNYLLIWSLYKGTIFIMETEYVMFFDGCSKGNPGLAGAGYVINKNNIEISSDAIFVGMNTTNNYAEYTGMIEGMKKAIEMNITKLTVKGDSMLAVKQMNNMYKVNSPNILPLYNTAKELQKKFTDISFVHVYREYNKRADELSNQGIYIFIKKLK